MFMKISNKELLLLLEKKADWYEAAEIADIFGVSTKTVSNYVKRINDYKENLILSSNKGYKLNRDFNIDNEKNSLFFNDDFKSRVNYILRSLLIENKEVSTYYLADSMFISDSHLETLLKHVKKTILKYDLTLTRKRNLIKLEGSEINKRHLLSYLLQKENANFFETSSSFYYSNIPNLKSFVRRIADILNEHEIYINDYNFNMLIIYFCILSERIKSQNVLNNDIAPSYSIYEDNKFFLQIVQTAENFFNIKLNKNELHYLFLIIRNNCNSFNQDHINMSNISDFVPQEIIDKSLSALLKLENYYHLSQFDEAFKIKIILHTMLMIDRINSPNMQSNSLLAQIKTKYPFIYDMSIYYVKEMFKEQYNKISDSEIAFLAIHIGAYVEDTYMSHDKLTCCFVYFNYHNYFSKQLDEISNRFRDSITIVASLNAKYVDQMPTNVDFIISNYPLLKNNQIPIIYIDEFLSAKNINLIGHFIESLLLEKHKHSFKEALKQFSTNRLFYRNISIEGFEQIISMITEDALKLGYCSSSFKKEVLDRKYISSTAFDSSVAIPHSLYHNCNHSFLAIAINEEQIYWDDKKVNIVLLIGVKAGDELFFKNVIDNIIPFFSERSNVLKCLGISTYNDFIEKLADEMFEKE